MNSGADFLHQYRHRLADYVHMSMAAGARSDYVQGGGGNTSCKLDDHLMVIKASGLRLNQVTADQGYAVLDYANLRDFYIKNDPSSLTDMEKQGAAAAIAAVRTIDGLHQLRPSVEAGFHSLLGAFVLHTHSVYANLAACAAEGPYIAKEALAGLPSGLVFVPYINPGVPLTFAINAASQAEIAAKGQAPAVIILENHGLIVTADTETACLALHDQVNARIAHFFNTGPGDWPKIDLQEIKPAGADSAARYLSATPWLREHLLGKPWNLDFFTRLSLYPDQIVFLNGQIAVMEQGGLAEILASGCAMPAKCTIFKATGEILYQCGRDEARTMEETICAVWFIQDMISRSGYTVKTMNEAGKEFISNWESEHYRQQVAGKSGKLD
jgi:ribulose-5-phosphate 4-epimerase/fuculose-1-phosphate aldolase